MPWPTPPNGFASERALYAALVDPAPEADEPVPFALTEPAEVLCSLDLAVKARVADGPVSTMLSPSATRRS
jgi:hypothetical protein